MKGREQYIPLAGTGQRGQNIRRKQRRQGRRAFLRSFLITFLLFAVAGTVFLVLQPNLPGLGLAPDDGAGANYNYTPGDGANIVGDIIEETPNIQQIDYIGTTEDITAADNPVGFLQQNPVTAGFVADNSLLPWYLQLANRYNFLDEDFAPQLTAVGGGHHFDARAADALLDMLEAAREEGLRPIIISTHRSIARQRTLFENQLAARMAEGMDEDEAFEAARRVVAYPGSSEHNLGLAADITSETHTALTAEFGATPEGIWLAQNAHNFGFVLRYPYHKQEITNIIYEPWHFRYVGAEHAAVMFEYGLVLEEYIFWLQNREL